MFIPLMKADAAQRLVYGSIDETPDRAGEVFDYATGKAAFEAWSKTFSDATSGKSFGNIRAQHDLKKAAGKLNEAIHFDDVAKRVSFVAKIVDDQDWEKVEEGVYTGFSPGGSYAKRWKDGDYTRYTPRVGELSIVDVPCIPSATFTMVKADGGEETRDFVMAKAYEPGNDATKERATEMAKTAGGEATFKDFVMQARADLIAENAVAELAKIAPAEGEEADAAAVVVAEPDEAPDAITAALAKADAALAEAAGEPTGPFADLAKTADALKLLKSDEPLLVKGLWTVQRLADLLQSFSYVQSEICIDAKIENDGSAQPAKAIEVMTSMGELLVTMVQEEVAELLATMPTMEPTALIEVSGDVLVMELANQIVDLVKADSDLMEKAGARNSKGDAAKIQSMHDNSVALGATCDTSADKVADLTAENERMSKVLGDATPRLEKLAKEVSRLNAENKTLKGLPVPPKGAILAVPKEQDAALAKTDDTAAQEGNDNLSLLDKARLARFAR